MARASFQTIAFEELVQNGACSARPKSKFLIRWSRASRPFALPSNTRKTELPSAALTRVFLARLGARTAPFALL